MADTLRSVDYFLNATTGKFDDNSTGAITAQMLRDFALSCFRPEIVNPGGRLTLTTATPVTTADVTAATTIYYTPFIHGGIGVYDATSWKFYTFTELTLALGTLTSGANYDVFIYDNAGTLTLIFGPAWTSNTGRGSGAGTTQLTTQNGVYVNAVSIASGPAATAGRYLGTIRTTATTTTEDSYGGASQAGGKRFVWNAYNRVTRHIGVIDTTDSWTYTTKTWRASNASANNKVDYVCGLLADMVYANAYALASNGNISSIGFSSGVGLSSTSVNSAAIRGGLSVTGIATAVDLRAEYVGYPGLGYSYLQWLEISAATGTTTWYGDNGDTISQTGLQAEVMA